MGHLLKISFEAKNLPAQDKEFVSGSRTFNTLSIGNFTVGSAPHIRTVTFLVRYSSGSSCSHSTSVNPCKDMIERL